MDDQIAETHLKQVAEARVEREWSAHRQCRGEQVALRVANPATRVGPVNHAMPEPRGTEPEAIAVVDHLQALSAALMVRGLCVRVEALQGMVTARGPGRTQLVVLAIHDDRSMHWYWCWPDPTRTSPPQYEYLARAHDARTAAYSIAEVLCPEPAEC